jgi:hypothetical protein
MKTLTIVAAAGLMLSGISSLMVAQTKSSQYRHVLHVLSTDPQQDKVQFTLVYCSGDSISSQSITEGVKETPFAMEVTGENFVSLIQAKSLNTQVSVSVTTTENYKETGSVQASFPLNVVRIHNQDVALSRY